MNRIALLDVNRTTARVLAVYADASPASEADAMAALKARGWVSGEVCRRLDAASPLLAVATGSCDCCGGLVCEPDQILCDRCRRPRRAA